MYTDIVGVMFWFTKRPFNLIEDFVQKLQESNYTHIIRSFVRTETNLIPPKETDEGECFLILYVRLHKHLYEKFNAEQELIAD